MNEVDSFVEVDFTNPMLSLWVIRSLCLGRNFPERDPSEQQRYLKTPHMWSPHRIGLKQVLYKRIFLRCRRCFHAERGVSVETSACTWWCVGVPSSCIWWHLHSVKNLNMPQVQMKGKSWSEPSKWNHCVFGLDLNSRKTSSTGVASKSWISSVKSFWSILLEFLIENDSRTFFLRLICSV